ncbi:MAG: catalase [Leptospira sp.]|nr:catalase [Leptospira sp.]
MKQPGKEWREVIAPGEAERFQKYAEQFIEIQKNKSRTFGNGRALHRKQITGLKARIEILKNLPEHATHGLFARPGTHEALIRISNGGMNIQPDRVPDIRGFSIKVLGINGPGALGEGNTKNQDFTLINHSTFSFPSSATFVDLVIAASKGIPDVLKFMVKTYGIFGGIKKIAETAKTMAIPFTGFATESFFSAAPISCGPYAVRVRLVPVGAKIDPHSSKSDLGKDLKKRLLTGSLQFEMQLQFYVDEQTTPIENPSIEWPESESPYVTVALLTIPSQDTEDASGKKLSDEIEKTYFDPWNALKEHRPLGDVMRARKYVYFASQKGRGAA